MSVRVGMKPIVTDGLSHVYDPISDISYPSGSETVYNHLPNEVCTAQGSGTDCIDRDWAKQNMTTYGAETDHQKLKGYLTLDGSNDQVYDGSYMKLSWPFTWCCWARATGTGDRILMNRSKHYQYSSYVPTTGIYMGMFSSLAKLTVQLYSSSNNNYYVTQNRTITCANVADSKWHFWCARVTANSNFKLNIDYDWSVGTDTGSTTNDPTNTQNLHIGSAWWYSGYGTGTEAKFWQGDIGPIYCYDREISDAEIKQNYEAGYDRFVAT